MTQKSQQDTIILYGNLGGDPKERTLKAKSGTRKYYDHIIDDVVEQDFNFPEVNFLTYSLATGGYGEKPLRWIFCVDWEGIGFRLRKGDHVRLKGFFQNRTYEKDGLLKDIRQFVVTDAQPITFKVRQQID
jgi:single-stranded DNA-binding protein